jgi:hypothetical protein
VHVLLPPKGASHEAARDSTAQRSETISISSMSEGKVMTLGYDTLRKRFVGSWVGPMMTYQWVYEGELDAAERVLTLNSEGPSFAGDGTMSKYPDVIEIKSNDVRTLTGQVALPDGSWKPFMTIEYRRRK